MVGNVIWVFVEDFVFLLVVKEFFLNWLRFDEVNTMSGGAFHGCLSFEHSVISE